MCAASLAACLSGSSATNARMIAIASWGKPSPWCDYSGTLPEGKRGLAVFDYPTNLRHPTRWHVRDYGLMTANCFGLSYFTDKAEYGNMDLKAGESLIFKYRVYIHSGDAKEAQVGERYKDYVEGPTAKFVK